MRALRAKVNSLGGKGSELDSRAQGFEVCVCVCACMCACMRSSDSGIAGSLD